MKLIYLIAAHYKPEQFGDLVHALGDVQIVAHIDAKSEEKDFRRASHGARIQFVAQSDRVDVRWGGWSQVLSTLAMLNAIRDDISDDDRIVLLSGDSYPLQSPEDVHQYFAENNQTQFLNIVRMPSEEVSKPIERMSRLYLEFDPRNGRRNTLPKVINRLGIPRNYRAALAGWTPYAGSTWWALTGAASRWIIKSIGDDTTFSRFCAHTKMPDEFFFQTLIGNSQYSSRTKRSLMYTDWSRPTGPKPAILDTDHIDGLERTGLRMEQAGYGEGIALFARKVTSRSVASDIRTRLWPVSLGSVL